MVSAAAMPSAPTKVRTTFRAGLGRSIRASDEVEAHYLSRVPSDSLESARVRDQTVTKRNSLPHHAPARPRLGVLGPANGGPIVVAWVGVHNRFTRV